jgi:hypothetical protein
MFLLSIASLAARMAGGLDPSQDLRLVYAVALTAAIAVVDELGRRRGVRLDAWIGVSFALFSTFIVLVPVLGLYGITRLTNRVEHFGAFAVLGTGMVAIGDRFATAVAERRLTSSERAIGLGVCWLLGWANEVIEFAIAHKRTFFDRDTVLDLVMNTAALLVVGALAQRRGRATMDGHDLRSLARRTGRDA